MDFLGFLSGFYQDFDLILIRFEFDSWSSYSGLRPLLDKFWTGSSPTFIPRKLDDRSLYSIMHFITLVASVTLVTFPRELLRIPLGAS